jgi:hypothetical protein
VVVAELLVFFLVFFCKAKSNQQTARQPAMHAPIFRLRRGKHLASWSVGAGVLLGLVWLYVSFPAAAPHLPPAAQHIDIDLAAVPQQAAQAEGFQPDPRPIRGPPIAPQRPSSPAPLRVMCVFVRNEVPFLLPWIAFHHSYGWNKFVFYDDQSTDGLEAFLATNLTSVKGLAPDQVVYRVANRSVVAEREARKGLSMSESQRHLYTQGQSYRACAHEFFARAQALTTLDADEYLYPCRPAWDSSDMFTSAVERSWGQTREKVQAAGVRLECFKYGWNGHVRTPRGGDTVHNYFLRAPYGGENHTLSAQGREFCDWFGRPDDHRAHCQNYGARKHVYLNRGSAAPISPDIHYFVGAPAIRQPSEDKKTSRHRDAWCCNHYQMRSFEGVGDKYRKNHTPMLLKRLDMKEMAASSPVWQFWEQVRDVDAAWLHDQLNAAAAGAEAEAEAGGDAGM